MALTSLRFLAVCIGLVITFPVALLVLWRKAPRSSRWPVPVLLIGILLAQATAVVAVGVNLNRDYGFYPTWSSLWGTPTAPPVVEARTPVEPRALNGAHRALLSVTSAPASDIGRFERTTLRGPRSGISQTVLTWLPPQYHERRYARTRFPVVMVLGGAEVRIQFVVNRLNFATTASQEIRSRRVTPFVAVFPEMNVAMPVETECTDYPGGPQAFTWLNQDVRNWATSTLRVIPDGRRWSVMGWSTGGYCAALLHLRAPSRFGAAASFEGYYAPGPGPSTGNLGQLLKKYPALLHEYSPDWLIGHHPPQHVHLLVMSSSTDPQSYQQARRFLQLTKNEAGVRPYLVKDLGHSLDAYQAVIAPILGWMAAVSDL